MQHFIYFLVLTFVLVGCSIFESDEKDKKEVVPVNTFGNYLSEDGDNNHKFFSDNVITIGNHHFIPLAVDGRPGEYPRLIMSLLELFEKVNPNLKVTGWSIEKQQLAYGTDAEIFGIWIDTEPRLK